MSFSFGGAATTTAATTFGTATPSTGFAFGSGDSKPLFGATNTENKSLFNFTSPTSQAGFAFGAAKTTAAAAPLFGSPTSTNANTGSAFGASKPLSLGGFAAAPNYTVGSPGFGQPAAQQNAPQNLSFGGATQQQQPAPAFGTPATQASTGLSFGSPGGGGFGFGPPAATGGINFSTPATGFSAAPQQPAQPTQQPQAGFLGASTAAPTFGQTSSFAKPAPSFGFGTTTSTPAFGGATTAVSAAPAFGTVSTTSAFQLGGAQPAATQQPQQQTGLSFGTTTTTSSGINFGLVSTPAPAYGSTGLNFGQPAASQAQPTAFGNPPSTQPQTGLGFGATSQPQTGLSFGTPASTAMAAPPLNFPASTAATGLSFTPPSSQPGISAAPTSASFGAKPAGLNFGTPASTAASAALSFGTATMTQTSTGVNFGTTPTPATSGISFAPATTAQTSTAFGVASTAATSTGLNFGTTTSTGLGFGTGTSGTGLTFPKPTTTVAASSAASTTAPSGISALKPPTTSTMPSLTTATTTAAAVPPQPFQSITFAQLEENINKWTLELEEQEKTFINQATQINAWDRLLITNGEKIVELNETVQTVKNDQQSLEHELDFVLAQQKELEDLLAPMEKQLLEDSGDRPRDPEREHMYSLAENLDSQLKQMSEDLKEVIEHLNETNRGQDSNDPIVQIGRILNAHMSSMQWIDSSIAQISTKLDHLKATHDTLRRDNERSFQLTYN